MLINFSNHAYAFWSEKQKQAAAVYGKAVDLAFPSVPAGADEIWIREQAEQKVEEILKLLNGDAGSAVMVQGEFTLTYSVVTRLLEHHLRVISACAERCVREVTDEDGNTVKQVRFEFDRFREYR